MSFKRAIVSTIIDSSTVVADESSSAIDMELLDNWSAQVIWTSTTAAGTVQIEESNDGSTWSTISGKTQAISNNSGNVMLSGTDFAGKWLRATVDYTSGSITTVKVHLVAKSK